MANVKYSTVVFGCGNTIMGDDGFGPAVIAELEARRLLPDRVSAVDAGTGIREYLFDYLLAPETMPERIIIVDAVDFPDRRPGEVFFLDVLSIPAQKIHDFSLHQFPSVNLLLELQQHTGVRVDILAAQVARIPEEIDPGLSAAVTGAIPLACEKILQLLSESAGT